MPVEDSGFREMPPRGDRGEDTSFDNLVRGVAKGSLSRRRALRLFGGALAASVLVFIPGMRDSGANVLANTNGNQTKVTIANGQVQATTKGGGGGNSGGGNGGGGNGGSGGNGGPNNKKRRRREQRRERRKERRKERRRDDNGGGNNPGGGGNTCEGADLQTDLANCGACGNVCTAPANATATCTNGACGFTCDAPFDNCDASDANGCETNTNTDVDNCGACDNVCPTPANATPTCTAGECGFTCNSGYTRIGNSCCPNTDVCMSGTNQVCGCGTGQACCGGTSSTLGICTALGTTTNCLSCGDACTAPPNATATCTATGCDFTCDVGFKRCGNGCIANTACCTAADCPAVTNGQATCTNGVCGGICNPSNPARTFCAAGTRQAGNCCRSCTANVCQ